MNKKKICFFTSSRADYDLLKPVIAYIKKDKNLNLQIIAAGSHFSYQHGLTYKEIIKDGYTISDKINIKQKENTSLSIINYCGKSLIKFSKTLNKLKPNIIVVLGDRYETLSFVISAMFLNIPIAHISGGETTLAAFDENIRHSITKMSMLHFVNHDLYKKRVIQLGENPKNIFNYGSLGSENYKKIRLITSKEIQQKYNFKFDKKNLLITFHSITLEKNSARLQIKEIIKALDNLESTQLIFTSSNTDTDGNIINEKISQYVKKNKHKAIFIKSLGQLYYFSILNYVDGVVGNSSSGIYEAPIFKIGTINIGKRQEGRLQSESIINCKPEEKSISTSISYLYSNKFNKILKKTRDIYAKKNTSYKIYMKLKSFKISNNMYKRFFDL